MPTREKIEEIINQMRINKSPGSNEIAKESPKYGSEKLKDDIQLVIKQVWETEEMPHSWKEPLITPLFKKCDRRSCENYRGNALLDVTYKQWHR